jgi:hypothetical protein
MDSTEEIKQLVRRHKHDGIESEHLSVTEDDLDFSDVTTADVSSTKHGLAPKGDGSTTKFLNANGAYSTPVGGMSLLGRATAAGSTTSVTTSAFTAKKSLLIYAKDTGGTSNDLGIQFNADSGTNYYWKLQRDVAAASNGSNAYFPLGNNQNTKNKGYFLSVENISTIEKIINGSGQEYSPNSSVDTIVRMHGFWQNTNSQITSVTLLSANAANLPAGSEIAVFGSD